MKQVHTILFSISLLFCFCWTSQAQETNADIKKDSNQLRYGLRIGTDLSKLARTAYDKDFSGFEINADYRLSKSWYIASEFGKAETTTSNDFLSVTAKGQYFKAGLDYNMHKNWLGLDNMVYAGFRFGKSDFSQTINNYTAYNTNQYWQPQFNSTQSLESNNLSAMWLELIIGIKAEVFNNLFIGINAQLKGMLNQDQPDNFENLFVPGFNKTYDASKIGLGYGYTISYLIPLFNK